MTPKDTEQRVDLSILVSFVFSTTPMCAVPKGYLLKGWLAHISGRQAPIRWSSDLHGTYELLSLITASTCVGCCQELLAYVVIPRAASARFLAHVEDSGSGRQER